MAVETMQNFIVPYLKIQIFAYIGKSQQASVSV